MLSPCWVLVTSQSSSTWSSSSTTLILLETLLNCRDKEVRLMPALCSGNKAFHFFYPQATNISNLSLTNSLQISASSPRRLADRIIMNRLEEMGDTLSCRRKDKWFTQKKGFFYTRLHFECVCKDCGGCGQMVGLVVGSACSSETLCILPWCRLLSPCFFCWPTACRASWQISVWSWFLPLSSSLSHWKQNRWSPVPRPGDKNTPTTLNSYLLWRDVFNVWDDKSTVYSLLDASEWYLGFSEERWAAGLLLSQKPGGDVTC